MSSLDHNELKKENSLNNGSISLFVKLVHVDIVSHPRIYWLKVQFFSNFGQGMDCTAKHWKEIQWQYTCKAPFFQLITSIFNSGFCPTFCLWDFPIIPFHRWRPNWIAGHSWNRGQLEIQSHLVLKTEFQDGGYRTRILTHKMIILAYFMTWYINFLAWRQRIISLVYFANNVIQLWPQVMPIFDR